MTILENEPMTASKILEGTEYGQTMEVYVTPKSLERRTVDPELLDFTGTATLFIEQLGGYENGHILMKIQKEENDPIHLLSTANMTFSWDKDNERLVLLPLPQADVLPDWNTERAFMDPFDYLTD